MKIEKSRFAALKIENDEESSSDKPTSKNPTSKGQQQQQPKKKNNKQKHKPDVANGSNTNGNGQQKPNGSQDWEVWKEKDEEVNYNTLLPIWLT